MGRFGRVVFVVGIVLLAAACHQNDTVFVVDTSLDTVDTNPGDGFCNDASGACSLRAAVMEANALPGVEEIRLVDGETYPLTILGDGEDASATGDLDFLEPVAVVGDGTLESWRLGEQGLEIVDVDGLVELDGMDFAGGDGLRVVGTSSIVTLIDTDADDVDRWIDLDGGTVVIEAASVVRTGTLEPSIHARSGTLSMTNVSTWQANRFIHAVDADVSVRHSTLTSGTRAPTLAPDGEGSISVESSYLSCDAEGNFVSLGHNASSGGCDLLDHPTDKDDVFEQFSFLFDNGGPVRTYLISPGGPLHDAGPPSGCGLALDARDEERPFGPACDIGATEIRPSPDCSARGSGLNLRFCDFSGQDLSGEVMIDSNFLAANLRQASLVGSDVRGSTFRQATLQITDFAGADLRGVYLANGSAIGLDGADLTGAEIANIDATSTRGTVFHNAEITDLDVNDLGNDASFNGATVRFSQISGSGVSFEGAELVSVRLYNLPGSNFRDSLVRQGNPATGSLTGDLQGSNVDGADLSDATMNYISSGSVMGTPAALPANVALANGYFVAWASRLSGADLSNLDLSSGSLGSVVAFDANFAGSTLPVSMRSAILERSDLTGASMDGVVAIDASFREATLVGASARNSSFRFGWFQDSSIVGVDFSGADLTNAAFDGALMLWNTFDNTICPSGVNSNDNGGNCDGQFVFGGPQPPGAPVPEEFQGREAEFATFGEREPAD